MTAEMLEADARTRRRALLVARVGVAALAVGCFRLSFDALRFAASDHGAVYPALAWIYALLPDAAIVICAALGYVASLDGDGHSPTVVLATVIEVAACALSTWANVVAADNNLPGMVMAGVPSPMLFACIELVKADLRRTRRHRLAAHAVSAVNELTADTEPDTDTDTDTARGRGHLHSVPNGQDVRGRGDMSADKKTASARVAEMVAAHEAAGGQVRDAGLTVAVAKTLGVSERTARRRLVPFRSGQVAPLTVTADGGAA